MKAKLLVPTQACLWTQNITVLFWLRISARLSVCEVHVRAAGAGKTSG